jgi:hypothetical protein
MFSTPDHTQGAQSGASDPDASLVEVGLVLFHGAAAITMMSLFATGRPRTAVMVATTMILTGSVMTAARVLRS